MFEQKFPCTSARSIIDLPNIFTVGDRFSVSAYTYTIS